MDKKIIMITRILKNECNAGLKTNPVTAILGPRQCGKTTLAKEMLKNIKKAIYLDLERPSDLAKLENAEWYLSGQKGKLVCIDEIQRKPELFPLIRSIVDENNTNGQFLILGSATQNLIKQSSESLAGRITYKTLTPFLINETANKISLETYMVKGGFPRSLLNTSFDSSLRWREDFITTYLERDIHQWIGTSSVSVRRIVTMLTHHNGQTVNYSALSNSLGISNVTLRNYIDLLAGTYMLDIVHPWNNNAGKRLVKAPKVYVRDTGIAGALLNLDTFEAMSGHPAFGSLWETMVLANLKGNFPNAEISFYRTNQGAELDFILNQKGKVIGIECKTNINPSLTKGNYISIDDVKPLKTLVIAPVKEKWEQSKNIIIAPLPTALKLIRNIIG
jgi:uncharacterized protein